MPTYNGVEYDSDEEVEFQIFLNCCEQHGLISLQDYQPQTFILAPKSFRQITKRFKTKPDRIEQKTLFQQHGYTPDWNVVFTPEFFKAFPKHKLWIQELDGPPDPVEPSFDGYGTCYVDVKGSWNRHGGDRLFPIHQKLMWSLHSKLVNKIVPQQFFKRIGVVPDEIKWMKSRKQKTPKKAYVHVDTFEDVFAAGSLAK